MKLPLLAIFTSLLLSGSCSQNPVKTGDDRGPASEQGAFEPHYLSSDWFIQNSELVNADHRQISLAGFSVAGWTPARVPSTVLGAVIDNDANLSQTVFTDRNILNLPGSGTYYVPGKSYSEAETSSESPFGHPWWYRTQFSVSSEASAQRKMTLHLEGINYAAEVWLNGHLLGSPTEIAGTYRTFSFDVTSELNLVSTNTLAILVYPPFLADLSSSWVDWSPTPQDKNLGIWKSIYVSASGDVSVNNPQVVTHLDLPSLNVAHLTIETNLSNHSDSAVSGELVASIGKTELRKKITLLPGEEREVSFSPSEFSELNVQNPKLWWPAQMGSPHLHRLSLSFYENEQISDSKKILFGIREVTSRLTPEGSRLFSINGKPIQIRGAGWASDMYLRFSEARTAEELQYVLDLGLNTVRIEGDFQPQQFYDLTDRYGILVMPGWVCCNAWQEEKKWPEKNFAIAQSSIRDVIYDLRAHPSVFTFLYGSDQAPLPRIEKIYVDALKKYHWPNPVLASAADTDTPLSGSSGVKMNGPYEYEPPSYWYVDKGKFGGAWGFNTETSPGSSIPPIASLRQFISKEHLWPIDDVIWNYHAGEEDFANINRFRHALDSRYGVSKSIEEFAMKSQVMGYDNHRAMFEAFGKNKYHSATGIIQWMLNNSWPSLEWNLYDYYLRQGGSYFGVKKSNEPVHIQYSYDDRSVVVVNGNYESAEGLRARVDVFDSSMNSLFSQSANLRVAADSTAFVLKIPKIDSLSKLYFIKLSLDDSHGQRLSNNFYWLSTQPEFFDWSKTDYINTPVTQDADLTDLNSLPKAQLTASVTIEAEAHGGTLVLKNSSDHLAFFIQSRLLAGDTEVLPLLWKDNDVSLIPGEQRALHFQVQSDVKLDPATTNIEVVGWNVERITVR